MAILCSSSVSASRAKTLTDSWTKHQSELNAFNLEQGRMKGSSSRERYRQHRMHPTTGVLVSAAYYRRRIKDETVHPIIEAPAGCCPATQRNRLQPRSSVAMRTAARRCARHDPPKDTASARSLARKSARRATMARPGQTGHE